MSAAFRAGGRRNAGYAIGMDNRRGVGLRRRSASGRSLCRPLGLAHVRDASALNFSVQRLPSPPLLTADDRMAEADAAFDHRTIR